MTEAPLGRVAICHEWLTTYGGSDQVAARIASLLGAEAVYTFTKRDGLVHDLFGDRSVRVAHRVGSWKLAREHWQWFVPVMPYAWSRLDLSGYDTIITSSHAFTNTIKAPKDAIHLSYCYTPIRYAWEWQSEMGRIPRWARPMWPSVGAVLRRLDRRWSRHVDSYMAISRFVADRIERAYGRTAEVVYPPVDTDFWSPSDETKDDYFLLAGRFVAYKRAHIAVEVCTELGLRLIIAGSGPELPRLRKVAGSNVEFIESPSNEELRQLYRRARALLFPGVEDFGLTVVESQSCGTPIIAYGRGGATETVIDGRTGVLYDDPSTEGLIEAIQRFETLDFDARVLRQQAERFAAAVFDERFLNTVARLTNEARAARA